MTKPVNPQRKYIFWLIAGILAVAAAFALDNAVDGALDVTKAAALKSFADWCSKLGEGWVPAVVGVLFALAYLVGNHPKTAARIFFVALTCEFTGLAATILRVLFGRTRPNNLEFPQGFYGVWHDGHWIIGQYKFSSFPSGHAATVAGVAAAAWLLHRGWGAVFAVYALAVIWSRVALQCHHLSDMLASTVLSIAMAIWLKRILLPFTETQFSRLNRKLWKNRF